MDITIFRVSQDHYEQILFLLRDNIGINLGGAKTILASCPVDISIEDENQCLKVVNSLKEMGCDVSASNHIFVPLSKKLQALHLDNDYDRFVYPNISNKQSDALSIFFNIGDDEHVAYYRIITADKSTPEKLIITDKGIRYRQFYQFWGFGLISADVNSKPKNEWIALWDEFDKVTYNPEDKRFYFFKGADNVGYAPRNYLVKKESPEICIDFAKILTEISSYYKSDEDKLDDIIGLESNGDFQKALLGINDLINTITDRSKLCILYYVQGRILVSSTSQDKGEDEIKDLTKKAIASLNSSLRLISDGDNDVLPYINYWMGMALAHIGDISCRDYFIKALDTNSSDDDDIVKESLDMLNQIEEKAAGSNGMWNDYSEEVDYKDRQYLMVSNDLKGCYDPIIKVFREKYMPNVDFPIGHPKIGTLYIAHPYRKGLYLPYDEANNAFFLEKVHELCYLAQCLGATEINITSIKGQSLSDMKSSSVNVNGEINVKVTSGSVGVTDDNSL